VNSIGRETQVMNAEAEHMQAAEVPSATNGAAVTITNASPPVRGRRIKFTPQVIEKIKELVGEGISRDEIANRVGVTVGSLQVTCSRLGISLRRIILRNDLGCHTANVRRTIPSPFSVGITHAQEQTEVPQPAARAAPSAKFAITVRHRGKEQTTDVPLPSPAIEVLALETMLRDLNIAGFIGQILVAAINKDMIHKLLR
jgi:hypothetical protein